jgi:regulator of replication initiation timing
MSQKEKAISKINTRIREIEELIKDVKRHDWNELVTERNSLSVNIKKLKERFTPKHTGYMDSWNVRKFNV